MNWRLVVVATIVFQAVTISVSPGSGPPGEAFVVTGSGFQAGERVRVLWDGANLGGTAKAGNDGTFSYEGAVPGSAAVGAHTIEARGKTGNAQTTFTVVVASPTTTAASTTITTTTTTTVASATTIPSSTTAATTTTAASPPPTARTSTTTALPVGSTTTAWVDTSTTSVGAFFPETVDSPNTTGVSPRQEAANHEVSGGVVWRVLVALATLATGAVVLRRRSRSAPSPVPVSDTLPEQAPAAPAVEVREGAFSRRGLHLAPVGRLIAAVGVEEGFVGVGCTTDDEEQVAVWVSRSGAGWEGRALLEPGRATAVVRWRGGMLMLGTLTTMPLTAGAWWSGDGAQWRRLTAADDPMLAGISFEGAAATAETVITFGRGPRGPGAWFTTEGHDWQPSTLQAGIDLIASVPGGLVAFGRHVDERRPLLALSPDGISWTEPAADSMFMLEGIAMASLLPFGGGLVAAGTDKMKGAATVWVSDDGYRWHRTPFEPEAGTSIEHLAAVDGQLVAVGSDAGRRRTGRPSSLAVWESTDGVKWDRVGSESLFATARATTVASNSTRVIICGVLAAGYGSPWTEPVPVTWIREVPVNTAPDTVAADSLPALAVT